MSLKNLLLQTLERLNIINRDEAKSLSMPRFWQNRSAVASILPDLLLPAAIIYYLIILYKRRNAEPGKLGIPVFCVGNVVAGGAGKTPVAIKIAKIFLARSKKIAFVSRGYMGAQTQPTRVNPATHTYKDVGDEALLLAKIAPTYVGENKLLVAKLAASEGAEILILDDGLQNYSLQKDISFNVVDGGFGFGNGFTYPAGPLREPLPAAMKKCAAAILIGEDKYDSATTLRKFTGNILAAEMKISIPDELKTAKIIAFAGIGRPQKFFDSLKKAGVLEVDGRAFPDHHDYKQEEIDQLISDAKQQNALLFTTEKDASRLPEYFLAMVKIIPAELEFSDQKRLENLLANLLQK